MSDSFEKWADDYALYAEREITKVDCKAAYLAGQAEYEQRVEELTDACDASLQRMIEAEAKCAELEEKVAVGLSCIQGQTTRIAELEREVQFLRNTIHNESLKAQAGVPKKWVCIKCRHESYGESPANCGCTFDTPTTEAQAVSSEPVACHREAMRMALEMLKEPYSHYGSPRYKEAIAALKEALK